MSEVVDTKLCDIDTSELSVFYAVIEQYYNENNYGFNIYRKFASDRWGSECSELRLIRMLSLIESVEKRGYVREYNITNLDMLLKMRSINSEQPHQSIDEHHNRVILTPDRKILNGRHRVAVCIYNNVPTVPCIITNRESNDKIIHDNILTSDEILLLDTTFERMQSKLKRMC